MDKLKADLPKSTPPVVSAQEWETARQQLLAKEKALTHARDAMAAERRRMPWLAVTQTYQFDGPQGKTGLLDLFDGRRQLILYRAFFEPGVYGWPDHGACSRSPSAWPSSIVSWPSRGRSSRRFCRNQCREFAASPSPRDTGR